MGGSSSTNENPLKKTLILLLQNMLEPRHDFYGGKSVARLGPLGGQLLFSSETSIKKQGLWKNQLPITTNNIAYPYDKDDQIAISNIYQTMISIVDIKKQMSTRQNEKKKLMAVIGQTDEATIFNCLFNIPIIKRYKFSKYSQVIVNDLSFLDSILMERMLKLVVLIRMIFLIQQLYLV